MKDALSDSSPNFTNRPSQLRTRFALVVLALLCSACLLLPSGPGKVDFESREHVIIRHTPPLSGTRFREKFLLADNHPGELFWLQSCSLKTLKNSEPGHSECLSRATVSILRPLRHLELHDLTQPILGPLFRFSPNLTSVELPKGFGIPINSNEPCQLFTESQFTEVVTEPVKVQFKATLSFQRERGREEVLKPLFAAQATGIVAADGEARYYDIAPSDAQSPTGSFGSGTSKLSIATDQTFEDSLGQEFADMWYLPPGTQESRTLVSPLLRLKNDTTLHFATGHLTLYGESLELRDITENRILIKFENDSEQSEEPKLSPFISQEGVPIFKEHQYELVARYNNTSSTRQRAAATMMLYLADKEFDEESPRP